MSARIRINPVTCEGHGLCAEMLPEMIVMDDWGFPIVSSEEVPPHLEAIARRARDLCPTLALLLEKKQVNAPGRAPTSRESRVRL